MTAPPTFTHTDAFVPSIQAPTVSNPVTIEAGDVFLDLWAEYDAEDGSILNVTVNNRLVSWQNVDAALKLLGVHDEHRRWADDLPACTLHSLNVDRLRSERQSLEAAE